jgi:hypothetical protein
MGYLLYKHNTVTHPPSIAEMPDQPTYRKGYPIKVHDKEKVCAKHLEQLYAMEMKPNAKVE